MHRILLAALCLMAPALHAQERSAAGAVDTQMTWSALKSLVDTATTTSIAAHNRLDLIEKCTKQAMFHAPKVTGADADGCVAQAKAPTVNYSKCVYAVDTTSGYTDENYNKAGQVWGTKIKTSYNALLYCPKDYVMVGVDSQNTKGAFCCLLSN